MKTINIADSQNRNSTVVLTPKKAVARLAYATKEAEPVQSVRVVKNTLDTDFATLTKETSAEELSQLLVDGDPEIDFELFGKQIQKTNRIYLGADNEPAHGVLIEEEVFAADGELQETRAEKVIEANVNTDIPVRWTGKMLPKNKFYSKFAFVAAYQITHVDGLTYDFLYSMAKELEEKESFMLVTAGEKGDKPLVFTRNATQYRGLLEGRTQGDSYLLIMHLSNLELKALAKGEE